MRMAGHRDDELLLQAESPAHVARLDDLVLQLQLCRKQLENFGRRTADLLQVIIGAVASRCRNLPVDPPPLAALHQACLLFEGASKTNSRAAKALVSALLHLLCRSLTLPQPVLLKMRDRAVRLHGPATKAETTPGGEELAILAGRPRLTLASSAPPLSVPSTAAAPTYPGTHAHPPVRGGWDYSVPHPGPHYAQPGIPEQPITGQHFDPYAAAIPQELWETSHQQPYPYAGEDHGQAVDFNLGDAWSTFMQSVGL